MNPNNPGSHQARHQWLVTFSPFLFVPIWSTGFTVAKAALPYAEPLTLLTLRFVLASAVLAVLIACVRPWRQSLRRIGRANIWHCLVVGALLHGAYLGGVFCAIKFGTDAGLTSLIVGLQPALTVALSSMFLGESLYARKIIGTILGFIGVAIVLVDRGIGVEGLTAIGLVFAIAALIGVTLGTVYQKRYVVDVPHLPSMCIQYFAAAVMLFVGAMLSETMHIDWTPTFIAALTWQVLVLSIAAVFLLMFMIRTGDVSRVASFAYLVPPLVVLQSWFWFDERISAVGFLGMAVCVLGVAMVTWQRKARV